MPKRLGKFELPSKLTKVEEGATPTYAKFIAEPFEAGYGHTVGNSLRRVLLSSIEGAAISSIKIEGVQHEFQSIDNVVEDVTDIVLNLKKILIVSQKREALSLLIKVSGRQGPVTAAYIQADPSITYALGTATATAYKNSKSLTGYDVGGGVEYAFTNNWTGRVEYRYYGFNSSTNSYTIFGAPVAFRNGNLTDNTVRVGLAYKFGAPAPGVAKY